MDDATIRNRLVQAAIAAIGASALTATLLLLFQEDVKPPAGLKASNAAGASTAGGQTKDVPKVGKGEDLMADYIGELNKMAAKAKASKHKVGYLDQFGQKIYIVAYPEHVRLLLSRITAHALWGGIKPASEAFFGKSVLFVLEGEEWKRLRGIMRAAISSQRIQLMEADVTSCAVDLCNRLERFAETGTVVDVNAAFAAFHLASVGKSTFNYNLDVLSTFPKLNDISTSFEYLLAELPRRSFHPDPKVSADYVSPNEDNLKWQKASRTVRNVVVKAIAKRLDDEASGNWRPRGDLLDTMITQYRATQAGSASDTDKARTANIMADVIGDNLVEMFFAGYNTSTVAMGTALFYMAQDPALMERVLDEVDSVIPVDIAAGQGLNAKQFPLLSRVFQEALRIVPPAPLVARLCTEDVDLGNGLTIPNGSNLWFPAYFMHKDKATWGPDADQFVPDRFLKPVAPGAFIPFSAGSRDCIGKHFAELESVVCLAVLLKSFTFSVAPGYQFMPLFTGFGFRPFDIADKTVSMKLIPRRRQESSVVMSDWSASKMSRRNSHSLLKGLDMDGSDLPKPPKFD